LNKETFGIVDRAIKRSKYIKSKKVATTLDTGIFKSSMQINYERWLYLYRAQILIQTRAVMKTNVKMVRAASIRRKMASKLIERRLSALAVEWCEVRRKVKQLEELARLEEEENNRKRELVR
jgi:hypothetical protein